MQEADYRRVTRDIAVAAAQTLYAVSPDAVFVFISGARADSSGHSSVMWARVKGESENALLQIPFRGVYVLRPAVIVPRHGIQSRTRLYRVLYRVLAPLLPLLLRWFPQYATTTETLGRAMIVIARRGASKRVLESGDLNAIPSPD
jgi:uncharacterized protein YbjT (DUF2867 family)